MPLYRLGLVQRALTWLRNAALRTVHTAFPLAARPDDAWARSRMPDAEYRLFEALGPAERRHAIDVARCVERRLAEASTDSSPGATPEVLIRAALLHDVGKLGSDNRAVWRVLSHLLGPSDAPSEPRRQGLAGVRQAARHHPSYGAALVTAAGGAAEVAELVAQHHEPPGDVGARLLRECDEIT